MACALVNKTKQLIVDFRKGKSREHTLVHIEGSAVQGVSSFKSLGVNISKDLSWAQQIGAMMENAHQWLYLMKRSQEI